jgi:hypothetical protein
MAHNPTFGSDSRSPAAERQKDDGTSLQRQGIVGESDIADLAAKFAAHAGGRMSPELSTGLALDIVLNEIVEQACVATAATGAAIILERDGEMVCRASSGVNAPELGVRLGSESGLTAECIKTRQVQRCDDAQSDPRADIEASRSLGVRSVMILPLLRNGVFAGVLEVFSSRPAVFGEWDQFALEALGRRISKNLEWGSVSIATVEQKLEDAVPMTARTELQDFPPRFGEPDSRRSGFGGATSKACTRRRDFRALRGGSSMRGAVRNPGRDASGLVGVEEQLGAGNEFGFQPRSDSA